MFPAFHQEIADLWSLAVQKGAQPTHLAENVRHKSTHLEFCNTLGLGAGGMQLDLFRSICKMVWNHPWLPNIIA